MIDHNTKGKKFLELLGRLGAGVNRKYLVRSTKFVNVYLHGIHFLAFQGHLLELLGRLGARVNRKVFAPQGQIILCFN